MNFRTSTALVINDNTGKVVAAFAGEDGPDKAEVFASERFSDYTVVRNDRELRAHRLWLRDRDRPTTHRW